MMRSKGWPFVTIEAYPFGHECVEIRLYTRYVTRIRPFEEREAGIQFGVTRNELRYDNFAALRKFDLSYRQLATLVFRESDADMRERLYINTAPSHYLRLK